MGNAGRPTPWLPPLQPLPFALLPLVSFGAEPGGRRAGTWQLPISRGRWQQAGILHLVEGDIFLCGVSAFES